MSNHKRHPAGPRDRDSCPERSDSWPVARGTGHGARATEHGSRSTGHGARVTEHGSRLAASGPIEQREKQLEILVVLALFGLGVYQSVLYFGHTVSPIADFPDIVRVGHDLLSLQLPARFLQAPVVGLLQASLSHVVGGPHPDLTAGWLLNALLHPLSVVLLYLVGRPVVGRAAVWLALLAALNSWTVFLLTQPIMETTYLFFILLTFFFMFRRSSWCYAFAGIAAMVRYEAAVLIPSALLLDVLHRRDRRQRLRALAYAVLATVPLGLWMLGTILHWGSEPHHYLRVLFGNQYAKGFTESVESRTGIVKHLQLLWTVGFRPLLYSSRAWAATVETLSKGVALSGFVFGCIHGVRQRQWRLLPLMLFFVPYFLVHAFYPYPIQRFHAPIFWIALLVCLFGLQGAWALACRSSLVASKRVCETGGLVKATHGWVAAASGVFGACRWFRPSAIGKACAKPTALPLPPADATQRRLASHTPSKATHDARRTTSCEPSRVPRLLAIGLQIVIVVGAIGYLCWLLELLPRVARISPRSVPLPWVALGVATLVFAGRVFVYRRRALGRELAILAVMSVAIVSNQFSLAPLLGDGLRESEFRDLARWYQAHARPGEKMGVYMAQTVRLFAPQAADQIVPLPAADSPSEFIEVCHKQDLTYVVWATREGMSTDHTGYRLMNLHVNIGHLGDPQKVTPPYRFVGQAGRPQGYVNIYRLLRPPGEERKK